MASLIALAVYFPAAGYDDATHAFASDKQIIINDKSYIFLKKFQHGFLVKNIKKEKGDNLLFISGNQTARFEYHLSRYKGALSANDKSD